MDTLIGGAGNDVLYGGKTAHGSVNGLDDADVFVFRKNDGIDRIFDFQDEIDKIALVDPDGVGYTVVSFGSGSKIFFGNTVITVNGIAPDELANDIIVRDSLIGI